MIPKTLNPQPLARLLYSGTSLIKKRLPLGPYSSICLKPYGVPSGGGAQDLKGLEDVPEAVRRDNEHAVLLVQPAKRLWSYFHFNS